MATRAALVVSLAGVALSFSQHNHAGVGPRYGGTLVRGYVGAPVELDPLLAATPIEREIARQIHDGFYRFDSTGEPVPDLVEHVEIGDGVVRFTLRSATFHDGRPVRIEDARYSLERFLRAPGAASLLVSAGVKHSPLVRIEGERDLILTVSGAPVLWPWLLADVHAAVVPMEAPASGIGAGPFRIAKHRADGGLQLEGWDLHHRGRPLFDGVEYRPFPDERALLLAQRHQGVDVVDAPTAPPGPGSATKLSGSELVVLRFNPKRPLLATVELRAVVANALGRSQLVEVVLGGRARDRRRLIEPPDGDDAEAVKDSASRSPMPLRVVRELSLLYPSGRELAPVADRIRVDLHAAGFTVTPRERKSRDLSLAVQGGEFDLALVPIALTEVAPAVTLAEVASRLAIELTATLRRTAIEIDPWKRGRDVFAAEHELLQSQELVPLFIRGRELLVNESIRGLTVDPGSCAILEDSWRWPFR